MNGGAERLDTCGCCAGIVKLTPAAVFNAPGQSALSFRVGTHASFKETMKASLADQAGLSGLTTREDDDPAIALLDAWATVLDVLTFYQERAANEGYLRTAVEQRSILELARTIGYELRPGTAAATSLAFELETAPGSPEIVQIGPRVKIQSIPGQDELPQTFEPIEEIEARPQWNAARARLAQPQLPAPGATECFLTGVDTNLNVGDMLLFVGNERLADPGSERWDVRELTVVEPDRAADRTRVAWADGLGWQLKGHVIEPAQANLHVLAFRRRAAFFGHNAPDWRAMPNELQGHYEPPEDATDWPNLSLQKVGTAGSGVNPANDVFLDTTYPKVVAGSWVLLVIPDSDFPQRGYRELYGVTASVEDARADFTLGVKTTRLTLSGESLIARFNDKIRETTVFLEGERVAVAEAPLADPVQGDEIELDRPIPRLEAGRALAISGKRARLAVRDGVTGLQLHPEGGSAAVALNPGDVLEALAPFATNAAGSRSWKVAFKGQSGDLTAGAAALVLVPAPEDAEVVTEQAETGAPLSDTDEQETLKLSGELDHAIDRVSLRIAANVARATHGESKTEVLGSGDGSQPFQRFTLKDAPLTYVPTADPSGGATTLTVTVNGVLWREVRALYGRGSRDRVYLVRIGDDGKATIEFGGGDTGARLPTGAENVRAAYRVGVGLRGQVKAGKLTLLTAPPLGVKAVTNPFPATGGADPESRDRARQNAPLTVVTFERVVSLQDFEDFAAAFSGVGKAQATWLWDGESRLVHVTAAADDGSPLSPDSVTYENLQAAIHASGDPHVRVRLEGHEPRTFTLAANVFLRAEYEPKAVLTRVAAALRDEFSFEQRAFGQSVAESEVVAAIQRTEGVEGVDMTNLALAGEAPTVNPILPALRARFEAEGKVLLPAQLLVLAPDGIELRTA